MSADLVEQALTLARNGIPCFPCSPADKSPLTKRGLYDATTDERQIRRWWCNQPDALIGTPTGLRFDALDIDPAGTEWLARAELPKTRTHHTRRAGGRHLLFAPTPGLRNSVSKIERGVDVRAKGGYVIWWPAHGFAVEHPSVLAPMPDWILEKLKPPPKPAYQVDYSHPDVVAEVPEVSSSYARYERPSEELLEAQIIGLCRTVATASEGERNNALYWAARRFVEMVDQNLVYEKAVRDLLLEAALRTGLPDEQTLKTIDSAFKNKGGRS